MSIHTSLPETEEASSTDEGQARIDDPLERVPEDRSLRVELEIDRGGHCVVDDIEGNVLDTDVRFKAGRCQADVDVREQTDDGIEMSTKHFNKSICEYCPRDIFTKYECIPRYLSFKEGGFTIEAYLRSSEDVSDLVTDIQERCEGVSLRSITSLDQQGYTESCTVDVSQLTPKQREAVHRAKELGYYDPDSDVELEEIAKQLDISTSALSQRLNRAEGNIVRQISCECDCWKDC